MQEIKYLLKDSFQKEGKNSFTLNFINDKKFHKVKTKGPALKFYIKLLDLDPTELGRRIKTWAKKCQQLYSINQMVYIQILQNLLNRILI